MRLPPALAFASLAFVIVQAGGSASAAQDSAQDPARVHEGRLLAQSLCGECHSLGGTTRSDRAAPDFSVIGAMPSTTPLSLRVFLKSTHANMPDLILEPAQIEALSAFILDLGDK